MAQGFSVSASMREWSPPHPRIRNLAERGVEVWFRPAPRPLWKHAWRLFTAPTQTWKHAWRVFVEPQEAATTIEAGRLLAAKRPGLVVISEGAAFPPIDLLELCVDRRLPFVTIQHANTEGFWVDD